MHPTHTPDDHVPRDAAHATEATDLPEVRRQLAVAFDSAPVGMAVTTDRGQLVQANQTLADLLGHPITGLLGRRLEDLAAPEAAPLITAGRTQMLTSGQLRDTTGSELRRATAHRCRYP